MSSDEALPGFGPTRSFRAPSMRDAFVQVKHTIGSEAIILQTRDHGASADPTLRFEVLAAFPATLGQTTTRTTSAPAAPPVPPLPTFPPPPRGAPEAESPDAALLRQIRLLEQAVTLLQSQLAHVGQVQVAAQTKPSAKTSSPPAALLDPPIAELVAAGLDQSSAEILVGRAVRRSAPRQGLAVARPPDIAAELVRTIRTGTPIWDQARGTVSAFIGPAGAGKTSTLLKIAGLASFRHQRSVAIISTDLDRLGTFEQLRMYADVMGIPLCAARDRAALEEALERFADVDLVLVDTPGANPFDEEARLRVMKVIASREVRQHLVLPATFAPAMLAELIHAHEGPALESIIVTKIDEARSVGPVVACCVHAEVPVSHITEGREIPDDIRAIDAQALTHAVLARAS